jgi:hypothetical protein
MGSVVGAENVRLMFRNLEATPRIELGMEVLQTSALPLGYVAPGPEWILPSEVHVDR